MAEQHSVRLLVSNLSDEECTVAFEPLGGVIRLPKGEVVTVNVSGLGDGIVEVSHSADGLIIGEWDGAKTTVVNRSGEIVRQE